MQQIVYLKVQDLHPHPNNPRKNLGDLTELADSIKAKGVLQNLTVVPAEEGGYTIIIGNRRHAASVLAEQTEVPCVIADMTPQEQFETMMVENVQRSDLTAYEQAEGFQMMLDMGGSVEQVAQKTGFSETTVRNRVRLLQLDKNKFQKAESRGGTMKDYIKLNMIQDQEQRDKVLDAIGTPNFNNMLKKALDEQSYEKELAIALKTLQEADWCKERTDETYGYGGEYQHYRYFDQSHRQPIEQPKDTDVASYIYSYMDNSRYINIYRKGPEKKEDPATERPNRYKRKADKIYSQLQKISDRHKEMRVEFVQNFSAYATNQMDIEALAARTLVDTYCAYVDKKLLGTLTGIPVENKNSNLIMDQEMWRKMLFNEPLQALLCSAHATLEYGTVRYCTTTYDSKLGFSYPKYEKNYKLDLLYNGLCSLGYEMSDEEIQMQDGTHPLFKEVEDLIAEYKKEAGNGKKQKS